MKTKTTSRYATKILALVLSLLMLLGAMPVALAAEGDIVTKWPTAAKEIEYGQTLADAGLNNDGETTVAGHFEYVTPTTKPTAVGVSSQAVRFVPDDTNTAPVEGTVDVTTLQSKSVELAAGSLVAANIQVGQTLDESTITKTGKFKLINYGTTVMPPIWKFFWSNPQKVMSAPGTFKEKVTLEPMVPAEQLKYAAFEVELEITVEGDPTAAVVAEIPMASEIICGQPLSDSTLTGGRVVKNGEDIPGTFAWKNPTIVPRKDEKCTVVFTPNDTTVCEPIEIDIPVNANLIPIEITEWPAVKCQYIVDGFIRECAVLEGGKANVPGEFKIDMDYFARIPADTKITDTFEVKVTFRPTSYDYDEVSKMIAVEFLPCDPNINISAEPKPNGKKGEIVVDGAVVNKANWDQHTGKFYYVLDGVSTEIDDYRFYNEYSCDNLAVGTHMAYCKYIPGENDVYAPFKTEEITFEIIGYYDVIVTDCTGTYVDGNYCAGRRIDAHAAPHENSYYEFTGWTVEGAEITEHNGLENAALYFTMPEGEVHLTANYKFNFKLFLEYSFTKVVVWLKDVVGKIFGGVTI